MKIKNLKISDKFTKAAAYTTAYALVATMSFVGCKMFTSSIVRDSMPEYSVEKITSLGDEEESIYSNDLADKDNYTKPRNKILEYNNWEKNNDCYERDIDVYYTDLKPKAIRELVENDLSVGEFLNKDYTIFEDSSKEEVNDSKIYKEAYLYKYLGERDLTSKEEKWLDSFTTNISLFVAVLSTLTDITYDHERSKRKIRRKK